MAYNTISCYFHLARAEYALGKVDDAITHANTVYKFLSKMRKSYQFDVRQSIELIDALKKFPNAPSAYLAKCGVIGYAPRPPETPRGNV